MTKQPDVALLGVDAANDRDLYLLELQRAEDCPQRIKLRRGKYYVALIVCDARKASVTAMEQLSRKLIETGAKYVCAWGPDCKRIHDMFDEVYVADYFDAGGNATILTTWHANESLADALWFAVKAAFPCDVYQDDCRAVVTICIDDSTSASQIRDALFDVEAFNDAILAADQN